MSYQSLASGRDLNCIGGMFAPVTTKWPLIRRRVSVVTASLFTSRPQALSRWCHHRAVSSAATPAATAVSLATRSGPLMDFPPFWISPGCPTPLAVFSCYDRWRHLGGSPARHEATDGEGNEKWKAACGSCISPIKTAKQPWLSAKAGMSRSKARAGCGSTFAQFTTSPAPTAHELNLKIFWSDARSRRGTWARVSQRLRSGAPSATSSVHVKMPPLRRQRA